MNKYVMIPIEQYERYRTFMKSSNENVKSVENKVKPDSKKESEIMSVKSTDDFPKEVVPDIDYKRDFSHEKSFKPDKNSRILPPPGLPDSKVYQKNHNGQQRGNGGKARGSKADWLQEWQTKF